MFSGTSNTKFLRQFIAFICIVLGNYNYLFSQSYSFGSNLTNGSVTTTCGGVFYDSGGLLGSYSANENYTVTFTSATNDPFRVTFTWFSLESTNTCSADRLIVYDGATTAAPILGTFCGTNSPSTITGSTKSLTFRFISDGGNQATGWAAILGCNDCASADCADFVNLVFENPTQVLDPSGLVGDTWRFPNVMTGYDALIEITNSVNTTELNSIDNPAGPPGAWSPEIKLNLNQNTDSYLDWKITLVAAGTNTPTNLPLSSRITSYDVDGNNNFNEIHGHINPNGYITNVPTELTFLNEPPYTMVLGSTTEHTAISNDPEVKVTFYYPGQNNTFFIRLGARTINSNGQSTRQFAVSFDPCATYTTPNVIPLVPSIAGALNTCDFPSIAYNTPNIFSSYTWAVNGGTILSGQGTQNVVVDWTTIGNRSIRLRTVDGNGCIANTTRSVQVNQNPTVSASNTGPYCVGGLLTLNGTASSGASPYSYVWNGPLSYSASGSPATRSNLLATHSGTYNLTVTDALSCTNTATTTVTIANDPTATINITSPTTVCVGASATLNATYTGGAGTCTIQWQSRAGASLWANISGATSATLNVANLSTTTDYRAVVSCSGIGCCD